MLWGKVISYHSIGFLMGASCSSRGPRGEDDRGHRERAAAAEAMGLITDHAYSLLAVMTGAGGVRLLKLRNPWGRGEWRGDWAPGSHNWTPQLKVQAAEAHASGSGNPDGGSGMFWMCWADFLTYLLRGMCIYEQNRDNLPLIWV